MKTILYVCRAAFTVATLAAAASPIEGTWEGSLHGLKAVILNAHEADGKLHGNVTFYVLRDEGPGRRIGGHTDVVMVDPQWDGRTLRFSVDVPGAASGDPSVAFEMTVTGTGAGELKRLARDGVPEQIVAMQRQK